jgi:hypothetical protein
LLFLSPLKFHLGGIHPVFFLTPLLHVWTQMRRLLAKC